MILDFGCGHNKRRGSIGVDGNKNSSADVIHNLNRFPYPFKTQSVKEIYITDTFFLLDNPILVMAEFNRILRKSGKLIISNPYFRSRFAFIDPFTKTFYTVHSFDFYSQSSLTAKRYKYSNCSFDIEKIRFNENLKNRFFKYLIVWFANIFPHKYESLSHFYPLDRITHYLIKR